MDAVDQPQRHVNPGNLLVWLDLDGNSLLGVRRAWVVGRQVDVVACVICPSLLALRVDCNDQVLASLEAKDAVLAPVVGLSHSSSHEGAVGPATRRPESLYLHPDCRVSIFVVYRTRDDARRLQAEHDILFDVADRELENPAGAESPLLPVALWRIAASAGHHGIAASLEDRK